MSEKATRAEPNSREDDASLAVRAAWLHYAGGLTQSDVAKKLGLTSLKAHRLITRANQDGLIKVFIDGNAAACVQLEQALSDRFGLSSCEVVPEFDPDDLPLKALGMAGARFLKQEIAQNPDMLIGVGHGRTLAACVDYLPKSQTAKTVRFVSLLGGLTRRMSATPHDVIHRLADRTGAEAYVMPVPFFANSPEDREMLLNQWGVRDVLDLGRTADLVLVGVGTAERETSMMSTGMIEQTEIDEIRAAGGVGEILGYFFDRTGNVLKTALSGRTMTLSFDDLKSRRIVVIAGGKSKVEGIRAVLASGIISGLITDELTAQQLVAER